MPARRPNPERHPQLKKWEAEWIEYEGRDALRITCPRCFGTAILTEPMRWFSSKRNIGKVARSCTYCFYTNRIPLELLDE